MKYLHVDTTYVQHKICNKIHQHKTLVVEVAIEYNLRSKG